MDHDDGEGSRVKKKKGVNEPHCVSVIIVCVVRDIPGIAKEHRTRKDAFISFENLRTNERWLMTMRRKRLLQYMNAAN